MFCAKKTAFCVTNRGNLMPEKSRQRIYPGGASYPVMFFQVDIEMDKEKREEEIYELRRQGVTYNHIATLFNISRSRAHQIYASAKYKREVLETLTPLRRM